MNNRIHVAVAVIVNQANEVCISLRHKNAHQGGLWEFPGGKLESEENIETALSREIKEELDLEIIDSRPLITIRYNYPDRQVCLHVRKVLNFSGVAKGVEGQQIQWVPIEKLVEYDFPKANAPIINALQLPEKYLITGGFYNAGDFFNKLNAALSLGIKLIQLRLKGNHLDKIKDVNSFISSVCLSCKQSNAKVLINLPTDLYDKLDLDGLEFAGIHADSKTLMELVSRPECLLFSASCHSKIELMKAEKLQADFVVLSPVKETSSHPGAKLLGWQQFESLVDDVSIPVYALGGVTSDDLEDAWLHGGQGIAAISALWDAEK